MVWANRFCSQLRQLHDIQVFLPGRAHAASIWLQLRGHGQALGALREASEQAHLHWPQPRQGRAEQPLQGMSGQLCCLTWNQ